MADLQDIVINIQLLTKPISQASFSLPLILGSRETGSLIEKYYEFSSLQEMADSDFTASDAEYKMCGAMFAQSPRPDKIAVYIRDDSDSISTALSSLVTTHNDWYALLITERDKSSLQEAGTWALQNEKMFFGCTDDLTALENRNNMREAYLLHTSPTIYPEAAWVGLCLPQDIGSITWKWKSPTGISAATFSTTQLTQIRNNKGNAVTQRSGVVYVNEGITTGGEYIDVIMSRDYVKARLEEGLFGLLIRNKKIPYDNNGFAMIEAAMREVFIDCGRRGIIAKVATEDDAKYSDEGAYMYTVTIPERNQIPANDRAERIVSGVEFSFVIAGAAHKVRIEGTIEV